MKFLFTSYKRLGYWDGEKQHTLKECNCYGLTWNEQDIFYSENVNTTMIRTLEGHDCGFEGLDNTHQILWHRGKLYVTNTSQDRVISWDGKHHKEIAFKPGRSDAYHINSLWCRGPCLYVLESGLTGSFPPVIRVLENDEVVDSIILERNHLLHNIYIENDFLYGCYKTIEPMSGIYKTSLKTRKMEKKPMGSDAFMRGLARTSKYFYFGMSLSEPREKRGIGDSTVLIMYKNFKIKDEIVLKDTGALCDIRIIDEPDLAHNGIACPFEGMDV